jgi:PAS domain S-box-containing protein
MDKEASRNKDTIKPYATDIILESISDGVFTVDLQWRVSSFNRAAEKITGIPRKETLGKPCAEVFRSSLCGAECALQQTIKSGRPVIGKSAYIINAEGDRIPVSISTAVLKDEHGKVIGGVEVFRDLSEIDALRHELEGRYRAGGLVSRSPLMRRVFEVLPAIAASPGTVLVQGETGTGKELVARALHDLSPRKDGPFIAVNCGALPDTLLESELFGYKAGAFTGAVRDKPGRFAQAKGGTLFLDEIGEVSPALQVRLLRVLQERMFEPLGSTRTEKADVRVVAATNRDLLQLCREGKFREDLYYRINVVRVELPPLRNRKEDIPLLADEFVRRFNHLQNKRVAGVSAKALSLLMAHDWPGNVRELENVIERAFILCGTESIKLQHLPDNLMRTDRTGTRAAAVGGLKAMRDAADAQAIRLALERSGGNRQAAARELGIHKTTLFRKIKALGIAPKEELESRNVIEKE